MQRSRESFCLQVASNWFRHEDLGDGGVPSSETEPPSSPSVDMPLCTARMMLLHAAARHVFSDGDDTSDPDAVHIGMSPMQRRATKVVIIPWGTNVHVWIPSTLARLQRKKICQVIHVDSRNYNDNSNPCTEGGVPAPELHQVDALRLHEHVDARMGSQLSSSTEKIILAIACSNGKTDSVRAAEHLARTSGHQTQPSRKHQRDKTRLNIKKVERCRQ
jgi:hypothetical protein